MGNQIDFKFEVNEMQWDRSSSVLFVTSGTESNKVTQINTYKFNKNIKYI